MSSPALCPECEQGKTVNCVGVALDFDIDDFVPCATTQLDQPDQPGGAS